MFKAMWQPETLRPEHAFAFDTRNREQSAIEFLEKTEFNWSSLLRHFNIQIFTPKNQTNCIMSIYPTLCMFELVHLPFPSLNKRGGLRYADIQHKTCQIHNFISPKLNTLNYRINELQRSNVPLDVQSNLG